MVKKSLLQSPWIAPDGAKLPDFIIAGAMKSGTSTLHDILSLHPSIYIPRGELGFFDIDDPFQHCNFNYFHQNRWYSQAMENSPDKFWQWYTRFFEGAGPGQLIGEDSTTYLASRRAIERIASQDKQIKLIVMLRQPTDRAYSQYWHMLREGLVSATFEETIRHNPEAVLQRSLYLEQLKKVYELLPDSQVRIVIFEEFIANRKEVLVEIARFLGVEPQGFPVRSGEVHANGCRIPRYVRLYIWKNRIIRGLSSVNPRENLPVKLPADKTFQAKLLRKFHQLFNVVNPLLLKNPPEMSLPTRQFLDDFFHRELAGIDQLIGKSVSRLWFER